MKEDGMIKMCIDYRELNKVNIKKSIRCSESKICWINYKAPAYFQRSIYDQVKGERGGYPQDSIPDSLRTLQVPGDVIWTD
jgi:hypothetical protein